MVVVVLWFPRLPRCLCCQRRRNATAYTAVDRRWVGLSGVGKERGGGDVYVHHIVTNRPHPRIDNIGPTKHTHTYTYTHLPSIHPSIHPKTHTNTHTQTNQINQPTTHTRTQTNQPNQPNQVALLYMQAREYEGSVRRLQRAIEGSVAQFREAARVCVCVCMGESVCMCWGGGIGCVCMYIWNIYMLCMGGCGCGCLE